MIKSVIKLGLLLIVGIVGYNYFLGTPAEQKQSKEIVDGLSKATKKVAGQIGSMLKTEKKKFNEGKFDEALDKIGSAIGDIKDSVADTKPEFKEQLKKLEKDRDKIKEQIGLKDGKMDQEKKEKLKKRFSNLVDKTQALLKAINED